MKLLANENFPLKSVLYLKSQGFDIVSIGVEKPGIQDHVVMNIAIVEERTILTFDSDYGELIFKYNFKPQKGVVYLRLEEYKADEPGKIIATLIDKNEYSFDNALTVIDKNGIRQRRYG
jgi:predicted nuclease of predicted toxin-antitoxin system